VTIIWSQNDLKFLQQMVEEADTRFVIKI